MFFADLENGLNVTHVLCGGKGPAWGCLYVVKSVFSYLTWSFKKTDFFCSKSCLRGGGGENGRFFDQKIDFSVKKSTILPLLENDQKNGQKIDFLKSL